MGVQFPPGAPNEPKIVGYQQTVNLTRLHVTTCSFYHVLLERVRAGGRLTAAARRRARARSKPGVVAHSGERLICIQKAAGSIPADSTHCCSGLVSEAPAWYAGD